MLLRQQHPRLHSETVIIRTEGDVDKQSPLTVIGGRGVFTSALQDALLHGEIDAAIHSAKDLPSADTNGLRFAAFLAREDPRDVLITRHRCSLGALPPSPIIGTSSRRRAAQVRHARPDAVVVDLRGNIDTRIKKALSAELDGIVIAAAGITRMGWGDQITEYLALDRFVPAPGQGALAVEVRASDAAGHLFDVLADAVTSIPVRVERAFLRAIGAGCTTPIGAHATLEGRDIRLRCMLASDDGSHAEWRTLVVPASEAETAAAELSRELLATIQGPPACPLSPSRALRGTSIVVTRPRRDAEELVRRIENEGGEALLAPSIRVDPFPFDSHTVAKRLEAGAWDWIAFTSRNAVEAFFTEIGRHRSLAVLLLSIQIAAVGDATAKAIRDHGLDVELVSAGKSAGDLVGELALRGLPGKSMLLPQGSLNRSDLADGLMERGAAVETVQVYTTSGETALPATATARLQRGQVDAITFTSPSSVREFMRLIDIGVERLADVVIGCIGETTATEARRLGFDWCVVAARPSAEDLVQTVAMALQDRTSGWKRSSHMTVTAPPVTPPFRRMRRLRRTEAIRHLVRETAVAADDFIYPLFITHERHVDRPISSMPGQAQHSLETLPAELVELVQLGIRAVLLFGIPESKDDQASGAHDPKGVVQRAVRVIKRDAPELLVITDVCACEYTAHGHCGILVDDRVDNDQTLGLLARVAVSHAEAGADIVAPSDMMDGRVLAIRQALDEAGHVDTPVLSYAAKYASAFYGPFRDAAESTPAFGDRRTHQMDPSNGREALAEIEIDLAEGADMVIVKPALPYLDVIRQARDTFAMPLIAYNVSGEYAMVKAAAQRGWIDERRITLETLTSIKRAGANRIITYHAKDAALWLRDE